MNIAHNNNWLIHYLPYFISVYFLPLFLLGEFRFATIGISIASFSPYLSAFFSTILKSNQKWVATESSQTRPTPVMVTIWPQVFIIILSLLSVLVGWYNVSDFGTTLVTTFWVLANASVLFLFIKNGLKSN